MKNFLFIFLVLVLSTMLWAEPAQIDEMHTATVNVAADYLNNICMDALAKLQLIAMTPEAQSGDWNGIKAYLSLAQERLPGVYFYVLPNGDYYTLGKDFTNLNLSNRGYFKPLFEGNTVKGYDILSRSTGKKSALMAAPIIKDGQVVGALGISVYLDALHNRINSDLGLSDNYTWFVVNGDGLIMLDMDKDFIFMNALTAVSSLGDKFSKVLKNESGDIRYSIDKLERVGFYKKLPEMNWWMIMAKKQELAGLKLPSTVISIHKFVPELQNSLNVIDTSAKTHIAAVQGSLKSENEIRNVMTAILEDNPSVVETVYLDTKGIMTYIEPSVYKNYEGSDISSQQHVIDVFKYQKPVFSSGFMAVEDFLAVVSVYPVFNDKNILTGSFILVLRPELMMQKLLKDVNIPQDNELWIMQTDGMIIYDDDPAEIGKMLFTDPAYADFEGLLSLGHKISEKSSGGGEYVFHLRNGSDKVYKSGNWDTVSLYGREWRVVLVHKLD